jgi:8-oxo-dGTP pyrophosphatase MutT (NUDIX family)
MEKTKPIRPRDASSLIIYRPNADGFDVLMGRRHKDHVFMPNRLVFPGGAIDSEDRCVIPGTDLKRDVAARLTRTLTPTRARALAAAAVRETFEETGLFLAAPIKEQPKQKLENWQAFYDRGMGPALGALDYFFRAVTPPGNVRRYDARFFLASVDRTQGDIAGDGEIIDIGWYNIAEVKIDPNVHGITARVLSEAETILINPGLLQERGARHSRHINGKQVITVEGEKL